MKYLTLADEIIVLMLRDDTGAINPARAASANIAIAGGLLMELSLLGRIDTDLTSLFVVDPSPVGDELLDHALREQGAGKVAASGWFGIGRGGLDAKAAMFWAFVGIPLAWGVWKTLQSAIKIF